MKSNKADVVITSVDPLINKSLLDKNNIYRLADLRDMVSASLNVFKNTLVFNDADSKKLKMYIDDISSSSICDTKECEEMRLKELII